MNQFKHIANLVILLSSFMDIIDDLQSKDLQVGVDFDLVAVAEYDEFDIPLPDYIRFSF